MKKLMLGLAGAMTVTLMSVSAFAQAAAGTPAGESNAFDKSSAAMIAAAIAISVAALGGALGQGRIGAAALEGIARNPEASGKLTGPMIISLAFVESLVLYAFVIALFVYNK